MRKNIFIACLVLLMQAVLCAQDLTAVREFKQLWKYDEATALLSDMIREQGPQPLLRRMRLLLRLHHKLCHSQ